MDNTQRLHGIDRRSESTLSEGANPNLDKEQSFHDDDHRLEVPISEGFYSNLDNELCTPLLDLRIRYIRIAQALLLPLYHLPVPWLIDIPESS